MASPDPTLLTSLFILTIDLILTGFTLEVLRRAGMGCKARKLLGGGLLLWLAFLSWRVGTGRLFPNDMAPALFFVTLLGTVGLFVVILFGVRALREPLLKAPQELLLLPQGLRVFLGANFIISASLGLMPVGFGIADGLTHITAGFLALKSGLLWARGDNNRKDIWFANLFGLLDIVAVATGLSFVLLPELTPNHNMMLAAFYAAPIFVGLHLASLAQMAGCCRKG